MTAGPVVRHAWENTGRRSQLVAICVFCSMHVGTPAVFESSKMETCHSAHCSLYSTTCHHSCWRRAPRALRRHSEDTRDRHGSRRTQTPPKETIKRPPGTAKRLPRPPGDHQETPSREHQGIIRRPRTTSSASRTTMATKTTTTRRPARNLQETRRPPKDHHETPNSCVWSHTRSAFPEILAGFRRIREHGGIASRTSARLPAPEYPCFGTAILKLPPVNLQDPHEHSPNRFPQVLLRLKVFKSISDVVFFTMNPGPGSRLTRILHK